MLRIAFLFCALLALLGCSKGTDIQHEQETKSPGTPSAQTSGTTRSDITGTDPEEDLLPSDEMQPANKKRWLHSDWTHNRRHFKKWREEIEQMHREFDEILKDLEKESEEEEKKKEKQPSKSSK